MRDMWKRNRHASNAGERNGRSKLTAEKVAEIRRMYAEGTKKQYELAATYGVTQPVISEIILRKIWKTS